VIVHLVTTVHRTCSFARAGSQIVRMEHAELVVQHAAEHTGGSKQVRIDVSDLLVAKPQSQPQAFLVDNN
jgi:hypothetical protein